MRSSYTVAALSFLSLIVASPAMASIEMYTVIDGKVEYADTYDTAEEALRAANSWLRQGVNTLCSVDGGALELCDIVISEPPPEQIDHRGSGRRGFALLDEQPGRTIAFYYTPQLT
ncbi:MAG: hypothetical protein HC781_21945 [Leptolyngbyaceae cyanobacterium CSU_1_4]|nr:hypothetical protein [Leptolyngbyaceae cyanobacterium CSU_1_4]